MSQLSLEVPSELQRLLDERVASGGYLDAGEYVRDLVRKDLAAADEDRRWLKAMIDEGLRSGVLDQEPEDVLDEIINEDPDLRG